MEWLWKWRNMILYMFVAVLTVGLACFVQKQRDTGNVGQFHNGNIRRSYCGYQPYASHITRRQGQNALCLLAIFTVLFLLSALRLEVGNDYESYVDTIHEIYVGGYVVTEPLFNAVVKLLCELSGGENYLLVFGFFGFITIWLFLKVIYEQSDDFPLAFFLFMTLGMYFRTFNTVRYYFVLAITLYSFRFVLRKEYVKFIMLIGLAAFFHKSVLVVLPLYLIANFPWKKWFVVVGIIGSAGMAIFQDLVIKIALKLYPSYENTIFLETETGLSGNLLSIVRCAAVLVFAVICYRESIKENKENQFYFKLNLMSIVLYVCCSFLPLVGRLGYYLMTSHILFIPSILGKIENEKKRKRLTALVIAAGIVYFLLFLRSANQPGVRVLPYKSWLFYEKEFLNAETIF